MTGSLSDYYIGQTEVTRALWGAVMDGSKHADGTALGAQVPAVTSGDGNYPIAMVSWNDIRDETSGFLKKLNTALAEQLPTGMRFCLPSEAQWEYAAKGGKYSNGYTYDGSSTVGDVAWYDNAGGQNTKVVATKPANELGLYDMSGNVWEWCEDWYADVAANANLGLDYVNTTTASARVHRGGRWGYAAVYCTVSFRSRSTPTSTYSSIGLRLALQPFPAQ